MYEDIESLIEQKDYMSAVLRMECRLLDGDLPAATLLDRIPGNLLDKSPLLLKARGVAGMNHGDIWRAREDLSLSLRGFANQHHPVQMLSAMALLSMVHLRIGLADEAAALILFLENEYRRREEGVDGYVHLALAEAGHILRLSEAPAKYYTEAWDCFIRDGQYLDYAVALIQGTITGNVRLESEEWALHLEALRRYAKIEVRLAPFAEALEGLKLFRERKWPQSLARFQRANVGIVSSGLDLLVRFHKLRTWLAMGMMREAADELGALEIGMRRHDADYVMRFEWELAKFYYGMCVNAGKAEPGTAGLQSLKSYLFLEGQLEKLREAEQMMISGIVVQNPGRPAWVVRCFGDLKFIGNSEEIGGIRWKRKKAHELLVFLLLQPHYAAHRDQVLDTLFPHTELAKASNQLYVATHQLKRVLAEYLRAEQGLVFADGVLSLEADMIDYTDAEKFNSLIKVGDQLWMSERGYAAEMYGEAVQLYDRIVPELQYVDWLEAFREQFLENQIRLLRKLGRYAAGKGDDETAETYYREWIRLRPEQEEAYQGMMCMLAQTGRKAELPYWYRKIEQICKTEFHAKPSKETMAIYHSGRGAKG